MNRAFLTSHLAARPGILYHGWIRQRQTGELIHYLSILAAVEASGSSSPVEEIAAWFSPVAARQLLHRIPVHRKSLQFALEAGFKSRGSYLYPNQ